MNCCNGDCRQGRDCPLATPEDAIGAVGWIVLAVVVVVALVVIGRVVGMRMHIPFF